MRCAEDHSCDRLAHFPYEMGVISVYTHELAARDARIFVTCVA